MRIYGDNIFYCLVNGVWEILGFLELGDLLVITVINRLRNLTGCLDFTGISLKFFKPSVCIKVEISGKILREPMISCLDSIEFRHVEIKDSLPINHASFVV